MSINDDDGRFAELVLKVDRQGDVGAQVLVARRAGFSWKILETLFLRSRQRLHELAEEARGRVSGKAEG